MDASLLRVNGLGLSCFYRNHSEKLKAREERGARQTDKPWPAAEEEEQEIIEATLPRQDGDLMRHWTRGVSLFSHGLVEYLEGEIAGTRAAFSYPGNRNTGYDSD